MQARFQKLLIGGIITLVIILIAMLVSVKQCSKKDQITPEDITSPSEQNTSQEKGQQPPAKDLKDIQITETSAQTSKSSKIESSPLGQPEEKVTPPKPKHDSELVVTQFMDAILELDPISARNFVDGDKVTYPQLAGLCIIFEDGEYRLPETRAIRKMFLQEKSAGWIAQLESNDQEKKAVFSITTKRKDLESPWKITEINLDQLLANYASRFSDGDIHYTPLIKDPAGGEALAIYFDLDSKSLTTRTQSQLNIVANILKNDPTKELTISGHTDALGSDAHNLTLSKQRAEQVMKHFLSKGVKNKQIKIIGYGKSQPRRPNTTESGLDAPDGRRANRRAEILLNF